jgi:hypothetical protein
VTNKSAPNSSSSSKTNSQPPLFAVTFPALLPMQKSDEAEDAKDQQQDQNTSERHVLFILVNIVVRQMTQQEINDWFKNESKEVIQRGHSTVSSH